jgi:hypothetical protein
MGTMPMKLPDAELQGLVRSVAESKAQELDIVITGPALRLIQQRAMPRLRRLNEEGELPFKQDEIASNVETFVEMLFDEGLGGRSGEVTANLVSDLFSKFCQRFPDFIPFCP